MRVRFGECMLDSETRQLFLRDREVHLQPKAFQLLELLLEQRPKVVTKEAIHEHLWTGTFVSDGTLTSLVAEVRGAIGDDGHEHRLIRTVHRFGYAFSGTVTDASDKQRARPADLTSTHWIVWGRQCIPIDPGETIIGRDPGAAVFIDDKSVSRRHARIAVTTSGATLEDLDSKNGTFLAGTRVSAPVPLADGDSLRIGSVALTIRIFPTPETTETAASSPKAVS
jgi:DNA-binding winged helix-turn-helix (wHTH) protein